MEIIVGHLLKGYEIKERIADGGFGSVYRAYQASIAREVAIKVILPRYASQPDFIRRFEAEAQVIARLEHMNVVPLYDYWRDPDGAFLVMRYLRGGSLRELIKQNHSLDIYTAARQFSQIVQGLHIAHRNNIIHRDIKPANILLDEDGNAYLADFGIAKDQTTSESITDPEALIGSPEYLAPEQARSEKVTPQTDIYSLGVLLYEMITGEHPFSAESKVAYIFKHLSEPLPEIEGLEPDIQSAVNEVIQIATAKDPKDRYTDVLLMLQALQSALHEDQASAPESLVERLTPREQEVLQLIMSGKSNQQIAHVLVLAVGTVKQYVSNIYRKLNVRSRVQAIARARDLDFVIGKPSTSSGSSLSALPDPINPYKGLQAFAAADEQDFFGREHLIDKMLQRLNYTDAAGRFLALVGPSGSGKSSAVRAGLIPELWRGAVSGSDNWYIIDLLPGQRPVDELEVALLRVAGSGTLNIREQLDRDSHGLLRIANLILPDDGSELLIVVDQLEELFTLVADEEVRTRFLNLLYRATTSERSRVRVIVTLRADYYDRPLQYPQFAELMRDCTETALPLGAEALEHAIVEPANRVGVTFEDGLVSRIVADVHYQPGALPLLQYALTELFEHRNGRLLTQEAYLGIGGAAGALAKRADEIYLETSDTNREEIRQLFLRLVTPGEGAEDTRNRITRASVRDNSPIPDEVDAIIDQFTEARLLSLDHHPITREPTVEIAHEALIRSWERLKAWVNQARDDLRLRRRLTVASSEWQDATHDSGLLARDTRLDQFEDWAQRSGLRLSVSEQDFLDASLQARVEREQHESARKAHEARTAQRVQNFQRASVLLFIMVIVAVGAIIAAVISLNNIQEQANVANTEIAAFNPMLTEVSQSIAAGQTQLQAIESQRLAALSQREFLDGEVDVQVPILLGIRALQTADTNEAREALQQIIDVPNFRGAVMGGHSGEIRDAVVYPDGRILSVPRSLQDTTMRLWSSEGEELALFEGHSDRILDVKILEDGRVLSWSWDNTLRLWNSDGVSLAIMEGHTGIITGSLELSDGRILSWARDWTLRLWSANGEPIVILQEDVNVWGVQIMPDGRLLVRYGDGTLRILTTDGEIEAEMIGHTNGVIEALLLPQGHILSRGYEDDLSLRIWSQDGAQVAVLEGHTSRITGMSVLDDGMILSWSWDRTLRSWSADGESLDVFEGHNGSVNGVEILSDDRLLTWSGDGTLRVWSRDGEGLDLFTFHSGSINGVKVLANEQILSWSQDGTLSLWNPNTGWRTVMEGHTDSVFEAQILADGRILSRSQDNTMRLWTPSGDAVGVLRGHTDYIYGTRLLDDHRILSWSRDGSLRLWTTSPETSGVWNYYAESISDIRELDDGRIISIGYDLHILNADGDQLASLEDDEDSSRTHIIDILPNGLIMFSDSSPPNDSLLVLSDELLFAGIVQLPDGSDVTHNLGDGQFATTTTLENEILIWSFEEATATELELSSEDFDLEQFLDGRLLVWELGEITVLTGHTDGVVGVQKLEDGRLLSWSVDNTLRLWSGDGQSLAVLVGHEDFIIGAQQLSDGRLLSWSLDGTLRTWTSEGDPIDTWQGHQGPVVGATELADGRILSWSSQIHIRSTDGETLQILEGHPAYADLGYSTLDVIQLDDERLASVGVEGTVRVWSPDGTLIRSLEGHGLSREFPGPGLLALKGDRILSWGEDGKLRMWYLNNDDMLAVACQYIDRDLTDAERTLYSLDDFPTCVEDSD